MVTLRSKYVSSVRYSVLNRHVANIIWKQIQIQNYTNIHLFIYRPKYRYPYYDENGRGKLLYGYGGPDLYQYKTYSALEGIH